MVNSTDIPPLDSIRHAGWRAAVARYGFATGNADTGGNLSNFIRAFGETRCNGFTFEPGYLQRADLQTFGQRLPANVRQAVDRHCRNVGGVLYLVRHFTGPRGKRKPVIHGWILMDHYGTACLWRTYPASAKSESCMAYALAEIWSDARRYNAIRARHAYARTLDRLN